MSNILEIDGSYLEGGGQIVRNALSFSCILGIPVRITNIRANRPKGGLSYQHLHTVNLLRDITNAQVEGNALQSTTVEFRPGAPSKETNYKVDTRTAASCTLVYQAVLPVLIFGPKTTNVEVVGGTNVSMAPQIEYMTEVFAPNLERFGASFDFELLQRGYYPRGNGRCILTLSPVKHLEAVKLNDFGEMVAVNGWSYVAGRLPISIAYDMQHTAEREMHRLWPNMQCKIEVFRESTDLSRDNGSGIILTGLTNKGCIFGASALGEKRVTGHVLGSTATRELSGYIKGEICIDAHLQDQLIIYMALANGESIISTCKLTNHTRTAIFVAELMTGVKFNVIHKQNGNTIISCIGIGHRNPHL